MVNLKGSPLSKPEGSRNTDIVGCVFNIERFAIRDGPGIRTTVFLKGCPLRCLWCANPESISAAPQLFYFENLCTRCYRCVEACPNKATLISPDGVIIIDRAICKACGKCVEACPNKAREISGKLMTVAEVLEEVKKDTLFYQNSGGGVTFSGGEPTHQPDFLWHLLKSSKESGLHTCLDTSGLVKPEVLKRMLEYTDLVLYDIKHMDAEKHKEYAGVDNRLILDNARLIVSLGKEMIIRVPLIPGHNDTPDNIKALAGFMKSLGLNKVDLLPYHSLGKIKYQRLGMEYKLGDLKPHTKEEIAQIKADLEAYGLKVGVG
ncbi:MAG: glycyl-radical enzyme activating protein [Chloroflexi bacterium]|nr:glycyl-radical enzyme activating protein [Chloroflexota bacterium]